MARDRVVICGGTGFLGKHLIANLAQNDLPIVVLSRSRNGVHDNIEFVHWDAKKKGQWINWLEGAAAVINLSGKRIDVRFSAKNRRQILESRLHSIQAITQGIEICSTPPRVYIQMSATGFYGNSNDLCDENSLAGSGFLAEVCSDCESVFFEKELNHTRRVLLRPGVILGSRGGALERLADLARWFLGGTAGSGRQIISWIHMEDMLRIIVLAISNPDIDGIFNAVAPAQTSNSQFMKSLRLVLKRPWSPPVPAAMIRLGTALLGVNASLVLEGQRVLPRRLTESGFEFRFANIDLALQDLLGEKTV